MEILIIPFLVALGTTIIVSIGPHLFRHGNDIFAEEALDLKAGFNWATSFQTWK